MLCFNVRLLHGVVTFHNVTLDGSTTECYDLLHHVIIFKTFFKIKHDKI